MKQTISVIMITKNAAETLARSLESVVSFADEIIVADDYSSDSTLEIAAQYKAHVFIHHEPNLGKQKRFALEKSTSDWVLMLDADEVVSEELQKELVHTISHADHSGYMIPFLNHFLGRAVRYGGENYKMLRLLKRDTVEIEALPVHEHFSSKNGTIGELKSYIYHYSYRSLRQMFSKFTGYALTEARYRAEKGESVTIKKLTLYPLHMFYARFIKDKGYKDGLLRIPLDLGFAYMEWLMYVAMMAYKKNKTTL